MLSAQVSGRALRSALHCAALGLGVSLFGCSESSSALPDECPDNVACASANELFDGVWRIEEVIAVEGDIERAPAIGDIVLYDTTQLRSFGNTDTSFESLDLEAGPVTDYRNSITEDRAMFETVVSFNGARPPVRIAIESALLADDVLSVNFETNLTEPTQVSMRLVKAPFLAETPGGPSVPLDLGDRAGTFLVTGSDRPLPAVLENGLLAVDSSGQVSAAFGRMPLDPRDFFDPSFVFNRATGREIALQLTDTNALGELGTMSLRAVTVDRDLMVAVLVDDGLLNPTGSETAYQIELTRIAGIELCGRVQTGEWEVRLFENGSEIFDLDDEPDIRSTRLYQAGCEIRIDSRDLTVGALHPDAGTSMHGTLRTDAGWNPTGSGFSSFGLIDPVFECFFTTTETFTGTFTTSDGRNGFVVGQTATGN